MAPALNLLETQTDLFSLDHRDPEQPDPFFWNEDTAIALDRPVPGPRVVAIDAPPKKTLRDHLSGVDAIIDTLEGLDDEQLDAGARDELSAMLIEQLAGTRAKVDSTSRVLAMYEGLEASAAAEIARLSARVTRYARRRERLTDYVLATLEASKLDMLQGETSTLILRKNPPAVVIDDASKIPAEFMREPPPPPPPAAVPDKTAIKKALKEQKPVPGARLAQGVRLERQ